MSKDATATAPPHSALNAIKALITDDFTQVNRVLSQNLHSAAHLVGDLSQHIVNSGGKRLRPMLVLLSAHACQASGDDAITLAAVIELIHTATLLHDDVVDDSSQRRGRPTANTVWGNPASVLVGDFLYSRAFQMMVALERMPVMAILSDATNIIAEGEVLQLMNRHNPDITAEAYQRVIYCKTAKLFEAAAQLGGIIGEQPSAVNQALARYGEHLGTAFQLVDDALDYDANSETLGKNIGDDLAEGKVTWPLIHALQHAPCAQQTLIKDAIRHGRLDDFDKVVAALTHTDAIAHTLKQAQKHAEQAQAQLKALPPSAYTQALADLADFAVARSH